MAMALPPMLSIALTTAAADCASLAYVIATLAPSAARHFAIAAPIPREPPVTSATLSFNLDMDFLRFPGALVLPDSTDLDLAPTCQTAIGCSNPDIGLDTLGNTIHFAQECIRVDGQPIRAQESPRIIETIAALAVNVL